MIIARIQAGLWKEYIPPMLSLGGTRFDRESGLSGDALKGMVDFTVDTSGVVLRMIGRGCEAVVRMPATVGLHGRWIIGCSPIEMVTRAANGLIRVEDLGPRLAFVSAGCRIEAQIAPSVDFPPMKVASDRRIMLVDQDRQAWAVADEPTTESNANDTIWIGITPQNHRLYVSGSSSSWVAMVRDGQDLQAISLPARIIRGISPKAGDVFSFSANGLIITRGMIEYSVGALSQDRKADTYPLAGNLIVKEQHRIRLNEGQVRRLGEILRVVNMGSDLNRLIPVLFRYEQGHIVIVGESQVVTGMGVVPAELVKGEEGWQIGLAGESILATLANFKGGVDISVTDGSKTGALMIWQGPLVSIRAALQVGHQDIHPDQIRRLIEGQALPLEAQEDLPEPDDETPQCLDRHSPEHEDLPEPL